ncbi:MAG: hypothetical protein AAF415_06835 [Pseudomonadota bacterium]
MGDELLSQGTLVEQDGIEIVGPMEVSLYTLSGGFYPQTGQDADGTYHSFVSGGSAGEFGGLRKALLADPPKHIFARDGDRICVVTILNLVGCEDGKPFQRVVRPLASADSFQQTLIYNGTLGSKINIAYREFSGNRARPAFNNEVEYDLSQSQEIAYKGARLEIIEANNSGITYRVLSNFR